MGMLDSHSDCGRSSIEGRPQIELDEFLALHGAKLLAVTRRFSANAADADDAYQRSMVVLLTKSASVDPENLLAWTLTVARNEALAIRREQSRNALQPFDDLASDMPGDSRDPSDAAVDNEQLQQGREALMRINPDQTRCLLLRADGLRYAEIARITGFSYAKVHRCLAEGRRLFNGHIQRLRSGAECRRIEPLLSLVIDGEAGASQRRDLAIHLKSCLVCQVTMREYRDADRQFGLLLPVGTALEADPGLLDRVAEALHGTAASIQERLLPHATAHTQIMETGFVQKSIAVAAIAATFVGGGLAVKQVTHDGHDRGSKPGSVADADSLTPGQMNLPVEPVRDDGSESPETPRGAKASDIANPDVAEGENAEQPPSNEQELFEDNSAPAPIANDNPSQTDATPDGGDAVGLTP